MLRKPKFVIVLTVFAVAIFVGWQLGSCELANYELQDDMKDLTAQMGARIGLAQASTDTEIRDTVVRKADKYGIQLPPYQVRVDRYGSYESPEISIRAEYDVPVNLLIYSFNIHFTPHASNRRD